MYNTKSENIAGKYSLNSIFKRRKMNLNFAKVSIAVCGFCVPLIMVGKMWASLPFLLGVVGILYYAYLNKNTDNNQK